MACGMRAGQMAKWASVRIVGAGPRRRGPLRVWFVEPLWSTLLAEQSVMHYMMSVPARVDGLALS